MVRSVAQLLANSMATLIIHAGQLLKYDTATDSWHEWFFLLRPAVLEHHAVGQPLGDEPVLMPLATAWVSAKLWQPRVDFVVITLQFRDPPGASPEMWCLAAASRTEARQWVDALETLGVQRSSSLASSTFRVGGHGELPETRTQPLCSALDSNSLCERSLSLALAPATAAAAAAPPAPLRLLQSPSPSHLQSTRRRESAPPSPFSPRATPINERPLAGGVHAGPFSPRGSEGAAPNNALSTGEVANECDELEDEIILATSWQGPQPCELCSLWVRLVVHSICSAMGPCMYELAECLAYPQAKLLTGGRIAAHWLSGRHWSYDAPPAGQLEELELPSIAEALRMHSGGAVGGSFDTSNSEHNEHNPYRCAALDGEEAVMADWRYRDAHEFALGASLGLTFILDALVAFGVFVAGLGALRADSVTLFIFVFTGAFFAMMLVYSLFVAARWQPPAVRCGCVTVVPAAVFRLLALAACLAYATSSSDSAVEALRSVDEAVAGDTGARSPAKQALLQGIVVLCFHLTQAFLNLCAAFVVLHRLWLQSTEDDRVWLVVHEQPTAAYHKRPSRLDAHTHMV